MEGVWARGTSKKYWDPLLISATGEGSNFKFGTHLGLGLTYQKTTFWTKIGGGVGQGSIKKNLGPLRIFATVEANNFKFGTQIGFVSSLPKTTFRTKIGGDLG